jgi:hypothetical protein
MRIIGENLYAKHSISYDSLKSYFNVFSIMSYIDADIFESETGRRPADDFVCHNVMSWEDIKTWCKLIDFNGDWLIPVPVIYQGVWDENIIKDIIKNLNLDEVEGIVVRNSDSFDFDDFENNVAKFVRKNHVQTNEHWTKNWTKNNIVS